MLANPLRNVGLRGHHALPQGKVRGKHQVPLLAGGWRRDAVGERAFDVGEERRAGGGVEACGGLVEEQRVGRARKGSREADALGLAAGEGAGGAVGEVLDAEARQRGGGDRSGAWVRGARR